MSLLKFKSIKSKIIHITLLVTLMITLLVVSICYHSFHTLLTNSLIESTNCQLQFISHSISSKLFPVINLSDWCSQKNILINYLTSPNEPLPSASYSAWQQLNEEYINNASKNYINRLVIGSDKKNYLHVSSISSFNAFNMVSTITNLSYFDTLYNSPNLNWIGIVPDPFGDCKDDKIIPLIRPIYSRYNSEKIGWNYISISTNLLTESLKEDTLPFDSNLLLTINHKTYNLLDPTFKEININLNKTNTSSQGNYFLTSLTDDKGHKRLYITITCDIKDWYLSQSLSPSEFKAQKKIYTYLILLICFIVLSSGLGLALYLNQLINHPITRILHKITCISNGDFSYDPTIEWPNEWGDIGKSINHLSENVLLLMDNRVQVEKEKKELEYQILQSQINPHFLYNTLNSIKWMATIQKSTGIAEMTTALSKLMRAISKDSAQIVNLEDELHLLDDYFLIQKYRYGGALSLKYDIQDETLYHFKLLKFTLQPIVENAIFHGIEPKGESGLITVKAYVLNKQEWIIEVTDNGIGMSEDQIQMLLTNEAEDQSEFFKKIGVHNVNQRIKYTFGPSYGLNIESELGHYTTFFIHLPCL